MDDRLLAAARMIKARRDAKRRRGGRDGAARIALPPLWVFTDWHRLPDPRPWLRRLPATLPPGLCGLVLRPLPGTTAAELRQIVRLCRGKNVAVAAAGGDAGPHCGDHRGSLRRGARAGGAPFITASAHRRAELVRAERGGAALVFLSPVFATNSHPGRMALGPVRWRGLAHATRLPAIALGGIAAADIRKLAGIGDGFAVVTAAL